MGLRDELDRISSDRQRIEAQTMGDEEVYQILVRAMYREYILEKIKKEFASGKRQIEGCFPLRFQMPFTEEMTWDRLAGNSEVYTKASGYDGDPDTCGFRELYISKNGFFKTHVNLTPLGQRVYQDLKGLAQKDGVFLSDPYPKITGGTAYGTGYVHGLMMVKFQYQYR